MTEAGVNLRPHLKTAKSINVAQRILDLTSGGITVSTLREAEYFQQQGIEDILYAVSIEPSKFPYAAAIAARGVQLTVILDSLEVATALADYRPPAGVQFRVLIEIDCGEHRTGLPVDSDQLVAIAACLSESKATHFAGVLTHAGHSYQCRSADEIRKVAAEERDAVVLASQRLKQSGFQCETVSVGSTPTASLAENLEGITEARPGVFVFYDLFQVGLGVCSPKDIALSVLTSVLSNQPGNGRAFVDAGGLALSKDRSTSALPTDLGYGRVCDVDGQMLDDLIVSNVHQEHGQIDLAPYDQPLFPIGRRLRILPNHACMTAAAYESYYVVDGGEVLDRWPRISGWDPLGR